MNYASAESKVNVQLLMALRSTTLRKKLELDNNSFAGSEAMSGFMASMVSQ